MEETTQNSTISSKSAQLDLDEELDSISALMYVDDSQEDVMQKISKAVEAYEKIAV